MIKKKDDTLMFNTIEEYLKYIANELKSNCEHTKVGEKCIFSYIGICDRDTNNCRLVNDAPEYWQV